MRAFAMFAFLVAGVALAQPSSLNCKYPSGSCVTASFTDTGDAGISGNMTVVGTETVNGNFVAACFAPPSTSGKVVATVAAGDIIDLAAGACGGTGSADTLKDASGVATFSSSAVFNAGSTSLSVGSGGVTQNGASDVTIQAGSGQGILKGSTNVQFVAGGSGRIQQFAGATEGARLDWGTSVETFGRLNDIALSWTASTIEPSISFGSGVLGSSDANVSGRLNTTGGGVIGIPSVANASLVACTASTWDGTHAGEGGLADDSTNHALAFCDGTAWRDITVTPVDWAWSPYDPVTVVGTTGDIAIIGALKSAATLQDVNYVVPIAGGGTGTLTTKLSSSANGGGTVFATGSIACNATAGTTGTYTINTAAIPANTTLHYAITAACTTADVPQQSTFHFSNP